MFVKNRPKIFEIFWTDLTESYITWTSMQIFAELEMNMVDYEKNLRDQKLPSIVKVSMNNP